MTEQTYRPPSSCPVCDGTLVTTRLGCHTCGTEIVGSFGHCDFCALDERETQLLRVFLSSRGNLREVEKHLGVSYPTARQRFTALLTKLGLAGDEVEVAPPPVREQVLAGVADGTIDPEDAARLLAELD